MDKRCGTVKPKETRVSDAQKILVERGKVYGPFDTLALLSQSLKDSMSDHPAYGDLSYAQTEALELIAHKIARIINGNNRHVDSWIDIAGYATLIAELIERENKEAQEKVAPLWASSIYEGDLSEQLPPVARSIPRPAPPF